MATIYKLLIADRDKQELLGIKWLISKYSFPITTIKLADQIGEVIDELENELPDILCIELDMIPEDKWEMVKSHIQLYARQVVAITAESTFERARQAMSVKAIDLWVKPLSPSRLKKTLQEAVHNREPSVPHIPNGERNNGIGYEDLFIDNNIPFVYPVHMLRTETMEDLNHLRMFIEQFDFYSEPITFSTSDRIILVFKDPFPDQLKQAQRFLREWENISGKSLAIAVYDELGNEDSLHVIYQKLIEVMETTFFTGYNQVLSVKGYHQWKSIDPFLTTEEQRKWVHMLAEKKGSEIKKWMYEEFFDIKAPYPDPGMLRTRLTSILAQVRRFMISKGLHNSEDAYKKTFHSILYSPVLYRIVQDVILFVNHLFQEIEKSDNRIDVIESAIVYMEENYHDYTLTLTEVAAHVDRSASYLSHIISEKYGQSFSELLLYIRMERAKELLSTTDDTIQNISASVGFNNPNYFSRVFKMYTGKTPRDWKGK
ncbi:helix-turn-helix domain-containing protein [Virgibacillus sp. 179-BFC.A HS]|uniref:Helix-turn-helix domain-containing protein n=1 Tax=Tigheibacillus jepli TaxID=3035914 RepID=A0ABU5CK59_9BACI|nr:helix-turn-helix domain-containing protein [Virgibacillus sp. 179-BFC.A HS]MDY0406316.1 helix-turn-helix domain-containing protein [Virgibacillus sp. 179-BFC.A HS]